MKSILFFLMLIFVTHVVLAQQKSLSLHNPINESREDELITLKFSFVEKAIKGITPNQHFSLIDSSGERIMIQFYDLDGDGKWDEAVFLSHSSRMKLNIYLQS